MECYCQTNLEDDKVLKLNSSSESFFLEMFGLKNKELLADMTNKTNETGKKISKTQEVRKYLKNFETSMTKAVKEQSQTEETLKTVRESVEKFMNNVSRRLSSSKTGIFEGSQLVGQGSAYEGTKVGDPNEYDYMLVCPALAKKICVCKSSRLPEKPMLRYLYNSEWEIQDIVNSNDFAVICKHITDALRHEITSTNWHLNTPLWLSGTHNDLNSGGFHYKDSNDHELWNFPFNLRAQSSSDDAPSIHIDLVIGIPCRIVLQDGETYNAYLVLHDFRMPNKNDHVTDSLYQKRTKEVEITKSPVYYPVVRITLKNFYIKNVKLKKLYILTKWTKEHTAVIWQHKSSHLLDQCVQPGLNSFSIKSMYMYKQMLKTAGEHKVNYMIEWIESLMNLRECKFNKTLRVTPLDLEILNIMAFVFSDSERNQCDLQELSFACKEYAEWERGLSETKNIAFLYERENGILSMLSILWKNKSITTPINSKYNIVQECEDGSISVYLQSRNILENNTNVSRQALHRNMQKNLEVCVLWLNSFFRDMQYFMRSKMTLESFDKFKNFVDTINNYKADQVTKNVINHINFDNDCEKCKRSESFQATQKIINESFLDSKMSFIVNYLLFYICLRCSAFSIIVHFFYLRAFFGDDVYNHSTFDDISHDINIFYFRQIRCIRVFFSISYLIYKHPHLLKYLQKSTSTVKIYIFLLLYISALFPFLHMPTIYLFVFIYCCVPFHILSTRSFWKFVLLLCIATIALFFTNQFLEPLMLRTTYIFDTISTLYVLEWIIPVLTIWLYLKRTFCISYSQVPKLIQPFSMV